MGSSNKFPAKRAGKDSEGHVGIEVITTENESGPFPLEVPNSDTFIQRDESSEDESGSESEISLRRETYTFSSI